MLPSSFMELLEPKKTTQPHEQDPKNDLLDHKRTQVATIKPKPRGRRRWLWLKDESLEDSATWLDYPACPASLDTLEVSVPPAVKLQPHFCAQPTLDPDIIAAE